MKADSTVRFETFRIRLTSRQDKVHLIKYADRKNFYESPCDIFFSETKNSFLTGSSKALVQ